MKLVIVSHRAVPGGGERQTATLAKVLPAEGIEVEVLVGEPGPLIDWLATVGCPVTLGGAGDAEAASLVASADAVLSIGAKAHLVGGHLARAAGAPALWWRTLTPRGRDYEHAADALPADAVICCTPDALRWQRAERAESRPVRIAPGVDARALLPRCREGAALRARHGLGDRPLVGIVSRLDPIKGHDLLLQAAPAVLERFPRALFVVVGGAMAGQEAHAGHVASLVAELGLTDHVVLTGHLDDPVPWTAALDVIVSGSEHECFSLSVVEAMALGVPAVTTATASGRTIVLDGVTGSIVPIGDRDALARAVRALLGDPAAAARMGRAARRRAARYDERVMARAVSRLVRRVVVRSDRPNGALAGSAAAFAGTAPSA